MHVYVYVYMWENSNITNRVVNQINTAEAVDYLKQYNTWHTCCHSCDFSVPVIYIAATTAATATATATGAAAAAAAAAVTLDGAVRKVAEPPLSLDVAALSFLTTPTRAPFRLLTSPFP